MVAPITGPIIQEIGGSGPDNQSYYSYQKKYRQAKPFTLSLPYSRHVGKVQSRIGNPPHGARRFGTQGAMSSTSFVDVQNKSYEKLKGRMYDSAQMAVNLLEGRQSLQMIANRTKQLFSFGNRLRKLDFAGATRILRLSATPKGVSVKKSLANNWLEYSFGWVPIISDIHSAVDILQSPLKEQFVSGGAATSGSTFANLQPPIEASRPGAFNGWVYHKFYERLYVEKVAMRQGVQVAVSNPNLFLANQLGLVNPATVVWELIPFSFVVDWFINVEQFLSSGTDFVGLTVQNPYNTQYLELRYEYYEFVRYRWYSNGVFSFTHKHDYLVSKGYHTVRNQGLASPILSVRPLKLPSWKRAANAVSLLVQQLSRF